MLLPVTAEGDPGLSYPEAGACSWKVLLCSLLRWHSPKHAHTHPVHKAVSGISQAFLLSACLCPKSSCAVNTDQNLVFQCGLHQAKMDLSIAWTIFPVHLPLLLSEEAEHSPTALLAQSCDIPAVSGCPGLLHCWQLCYFAGVIDLLVSSQLFTKIITIFSSALKHGILHSASNNISLSRLAVELLTLTCSTFP